MSIFSHFFFEKNLLIIHHHYKMDLFKILNGGVLWIKIQMRSRSVKS